MLVIALGSHYKFVDYRPLPDVSAIEYSAFVLIAAILLLIALKINPITTPWVSAKLILLICYIVLGSIALKRGRTKLARSIAYFCALAVFIEIYTIARKHDVNIF